MIKGQLITPKQLDDALKYQRVKGGRLGICLLKLGYITEEVLHSAMRFSLSHLLTEAEIDEAARRIAAVVGRLRRTDGVCEEH